MIVAEIRVASMTTITLTCNSLHYNLYIIHTQDWHVTHTQWLHTYTLGVYQSWHVMK